MRHATQKNKPGQTAHSRRGPGLRSRQQTPQRALSTCVRDSENATAAAHAPPPPPAPPHAPLPLPPPPSPPPGTTTAAAAAQPASFDAISRRPLPDLQISAILEISDTVVVMAASAIEEEAEFTLFKHSEVFLYKVPPQVSAAGHKCVGAAARRGAGRARAPRWSARAREQRRGCAAR